MEKVFRLRQSSGYGEIISKLDNREIRLLELNSGSTGAQMLHDELAKSMAFESSTVKRSQQRNNVQAVVEPAIPIPIPIQPTTDHRNGNLAFSSSSSFYIDTTTATGNRDVCVLSSSARAAVTENDVVEDIEAENIATETLIKDANVVADIIGANEMGDAREGEAHGGIGEEQNGNSASGDEQTGLENEEDKAGKERERERERKREGDGDGSVQKIVEMIEESKDIVDVEDDIAVEEEKVSKRTENKDVVEVIVPDNAVGEEIEEEGVNVPSVVALAGVIPDALEGQGEVQGEVQGEGEGEEYAGVGAGDGREMHEEATVAAPSSSKKSDAKRKLLSFQNSDSSAQSNSNGDSPWFSEKLVDSSGTKKRGRPSSRESPESASPSPSPPSISSPMSSKHNKSSPVAAVPVPVAGSSSSSGGQSSSSGQGQSTETTSQGPKPTCPKGDFIKQAKGQRFTDKNGTIYPKKGDEIRVLYDEKDWYAGFVNDFDKEAQIVTVAFEEDGETEIDTREFPDEDILVMFADLGTTQRNGGRPLNPKLSKNDLVLKDLKKDISDVIGLQYAEMYLVKKRLCEYWCTVIDVKVVKGKDVCTCQWSDGSKTKEPLKKVMDSINLNRANERRGKNGAAAPFLNLQSEPNQGDIGSGIKVTSPSCERNSGSSNKSKVEVGRHTESCIMDTSLTIDDDPEDPEPCSMNENSKINNDSEDQRKSKETCTADEETDSASGNDLNEIKETCTADEETDSASGNDLNEFPIRNKGPNNDDKSEGQGKAHETRAKDEETDSASGNELAESHILDNSSNSNDKSKDQSEAQRSHTGDEVTDSPSPSGRDLVESHILDNGSNISDKSKDQSKAPETSTEEERMASTSVMVLTEVVSAKENQEHVSLEDVEVVVDGGVGLNSTDVLDRPDDEDLKEVTYESIMAAANDSSPRVEKSFEEPSKTSSSSASRSINDTAASFTSIRNEEALIHSNITDDEQSVEKGLEVGGPVSNDPSASIVISSSGPQSQIEFLIARIQQLERNKLISSMPPNGERDEGHLSQRELFLIDRIQQLERIILVSSMPECDHKDDGSPDKKKRRK